MNYQKFKRKIKVGMVAGAMLMMNFSALPTFASELYPGHDYVPLNNSGEPVFYISRIDPTNNELEFTLDKEVVNESEIQGVEVGWISDRSSNVLEMDVLSYETASNSWSQRVFANGETSFSTYFSEENDFYRKYLVPTEVDLKNNVFKDLFYIVNLDNGEKWINSIDYGDCGYAWYYGESCDVIGFMAGMELNNIFYQLVDTTMKDTGVEPEPAPVSEPESEPVVEPLEPEPTVEPADELVIKPEKTEAELESTVKDEQETPRKIATVASFVKDVKEMNSGGDSEENNDETEVLEGSGDTVLDVPLLGKAEEKTENPLWWLPFFIGGTAFGAVSTWFLFFIFDRHKRNRTYII